MDNRHARWWAFACSFLIYLLPLVGPHGAFTFALALVGEMAATGGGRPPLWLAADLALAVAVQAAAGLILYWFFSKLGDAVYVLRASDGVSVFRRNLPRYARSQVTFLGPEFFAYTHYDGARTEVRVLRVSGS